MRLFSIKKPSRLVYATVITPLLFLSLLTLHGCGKNITHVPAADPIPLPQYEVGTTYIYSNSSSETVVQTDNTQVIWQNHLGLISTGSRDFTYRRFSWQTKTKEGELQITPLHRKNGKAYADSLWPLQPGNKARYIETGSWTDVTGTLHNYTNYWRTEVVAQQRLTVMAGEFDTYMITARRYSLKQSTNTQQLRETITYYFAPEVGHYIRMVKHKRDKTPPTTIDLVAMQPPLSQYPSTVAAAITDNLQLALETYHSNTQHIWNVEDFGISGTITPTSTYRRGSDQFCRTYKQQIGITGKTQGNYYGFQCRGNNGKWFIP